VASRAFGRRIAAIVPLILIAIGVSACTSDVAQQQQHQAMIKASDKALDRDRIQVQTGDLALPYDQLGALTYAEPFSPRAIDEDYINDRLRTMAITKWGNQVDAVIGVKTALNADASQVSVTGEAVRVRGDCSFCRHQGGYPNGQ
jgi:hypothetical protein